MMDGDKPNEKKGSALRGDTPSIGISKGQESSLEELTAEFHQVLLKGDVKELHAALKALKKLNGVHKGTARMLKNFRDEEQMCALHIAIDRNNLPLVMFILSKCPELVNEHSNKTQCTPLILAAIKGHLDICKFLLTVKKLDVNLVNIDNTSALHYLVRHRPKSQEEWRTQLELYRLAIKKKTELNGETLRGETPLHQATRVGNESAIVMLAKHGADINKQNKNGETALHYAVMSGHSDTVDKLLDHHARKDIKNNEELTALDIARKEHRQEIADMIMYWNDNKDVRTEEKQRIKVLRQYEKLVLLLNEVHFFAKALSIYTDKGDYDRLAKGLIHISVPTGTTIQLIRSLIQVEFEKNKHTASVLRGNCPASKVMGAFSRQIGQEYLQGCVGNIVRSLVLDDSISFELDENKMRDVDKLEETLKKNKDALVEFATNVLQKLTSEEKIKSMPREIRAIAGFIAEYTRKYCPDKETSLVGGFIMLRFINPALVAPESYEMLPLGKSPSQQGRRNLILLTKLLQNLSNDIEFGVKEPHMAVVNEYILTYRDSMSEFLKKIARDPIVEPGKEEWADCKVLNVRAIVDIKMLDLKELQFLHRLLIIHREELQKQLNEEKASGDVSNEEYAHAMLVFKTLDHLAAQKDIIAMLEQTQGATSGSS